MQGAGPHQHLSGRIRRATLHVHRWESPAFHRPFISCLEDSELKMERYGKMDWVNWEEIRGQSTLNLHQSVSQRRRPGCQMHISHAAQSWQRKGQSSHRCPSGSFDGASKEPKKNIRQNMLKPYRIFPVFQVPLEPSQHYQDDFYFLCICFWQHMSPHIHAFSCQLLGLLDFLHSQSLPSYEAHWRVDLVDHIQTLREKMKNIKTKWSK